MINNIGIIGGGTAGLVTALYLRKIYPKLKIDLVESKSIGIVGVGEGTTEHWRDFMVECNIMHSDLLKETDATFKYGINFKNWNGDNENFLHTVSSSYNIESSTRDKIIYAWLIANGKTAKSLTYDYIENNLHRFPYWSVNQFHFDTFKLNEYLHKVCKNRSINIIEANIKNVSLTSNGFIDKLLTDDSRKLHYDFFVDCTGFHRLLLEKTLNVKWKDYTRYLPINKAIVFPCDRQEQLPSWTLAEALNNGWRWQIPTQSRFGNGYVFCDNFCTEDQALEEIETIFGKIDNARSIKFSAGTLDQFWVKNCAGVGLATSFVEPLEASSIGFSIIQATLLTNYIGNYIPNTENLYAQKEYNKNCSKIMDNILDFIALHYQGKRNDTEFWKYTKAMPKPDSLVEKLNLFKFIFPKDSQFDYKNYMFKAANWIHVLHGLQLIEPSVAQRCLEYQPDHMQNNIQNLVSNTLDYEREIEITKQMFPDDTTPNFVSHKEAIEWLINNPEHENEIN